MKLLVKTDGAPKALGPYSQGVVIGSWLFVSGQLGIDPNTGDLVSGGAGPEAKRALQNIEAVVKTAGGRMSQVVRVTLYLKDMDHFSLVNEVFSEYFTDHPPARATVAVADLPRKALVEIEAQAYLDTQENR